MAAKAPNRPPIFVCTGDEFLRRRTINALLDELVPKDLRPSNLFRIYPDEFDCSRLITLAQTPSLLGGAQVFWIIQAERIKKDEWTLLESFLEANSRRRSSSSYFIFEADGLPKTHALAKLAQRFGIFSNLERRGEEKSRDLWREKLKRAGKALAPDAWRVLEERLGGSTRLMDSCLDQLMLYSSGPVIDAETVNKLSTQFLAFEPFDLTEALAQKDIARALSIFRYFYELEGELASVIGLLHWQLKRIGQAKRILKRGGNDDEVGRMLKVSPFRLASFLNQVRKFDDSAVGELVDELWRLDWNIKTGASEEVTAMETFLASVR